MKYAAFGPGGNSDSFRTWGGKSTFDAPRFVEEIGLDAYEFEAGRGVPRIGADAYLALGEEAARRGVRMSFHAPYFISLSGTETETRLKSIGYIRESLDAAAALGARIIVVHTGSAGKITRAEAMRLAADTVYKTLETVDTHGVLIGLETMGKKNQLGTLDEVIELCKMDARLAPVVDFGHLNARDLGGVFPDADSYRRVFDTIGATLGDEVARNLHCHFSKIEWTDAGEKKHLTFADTTFGPEYEPLMDAIAREGLTPTIISESAGTQSEDALTMKRAYRAFLGEQNHE